MNKIFNSSESAPELNTILPVFESLEPRQLLSATVSDFSYFGEPGTGGRVDAISVNPNVPTDVLFSGDLFGSAYSDDRGNTWTGQTATPSLTNYQMGDFTWDPANGGTWSGNDRVWVGSLGGPALSTDGGKSFVTKNNGMDVPGNGFNGSVEKVLFDETDTEGDRLLAFGGDHRELDVGSIGNPSLGWLWISENNGDSWSAVTGHQIDGVSNNFHGDNILDAEINNNKDTVYIAVKDRGVFRSTSTTGGKLNLKNWSTRNGSGANSLPTDVTSLLLDPNDNDGSTMWAVSQQQGVFYTTDGGSNWHERRSGLPLEEGSKKPRYKSIEYASGSGDDVTLYLGHAPDNGLGEGVYKTTTSGKRPAPSVDAWTLTTPSNSIPDSFVPNSRNIWWIEVDPSNSNRIYAGGTEDIIRSNDGGDSWTSLHSDKVTGTDRFRSQGASGWVNSSIEAHPSNTNIVATQSFDSAKFLLTEDGGDTWTQRRGSDLGGSNSNFGGGWDLDYYDNNKLFGVFGAQKNNGTDAEIGRSNNGGDTWDLLSLNKAPGQGGGTIDNGREFVRIVVSRSNPNNLWVLDTDGNVWHSTDADGNKNDVEWTKVNQSGVKVYDIAGNPNNGNGLYVARADGLFYASNGVSGFSELGTNSNVVFSDSGDDLHLHVPEGITDRKVVYWASSISDNNQRGLWRYDDNATGSQWERLKNERWVREVATSPTDPELVAYTTNKDAFNDVLGATGVWFSDDNGENFDTINNGLPMLRTGAITFDSDGGKLYVGTLGRGVYVAEVTSTNETETLIQAFGGQSDFGYSENFGGDSMKLKPVSEHTRGLNMTNGRYEIANLSKQDAGTDVWAQVATNGVSIEGGPATFRVNMTADSGMENSGPWVDYARVSYQVQINGSWQGWQDVETVFGNDRGTAFTIQKEGIIGDRLQIRVRASSTGSNEVYGIDEIQIERASETASPDTVRKVEFEEFVGFGNNDDVWRTSTNSGGRTFGWVPSVGSTTNDRWYGDGPQPQSTSPRITYQLSGMEAGTYDIRAHVNTSHQGTGERGGNNSLYIRANGGSWFYLDAALASGWSTSIHDTANLTLNAGVNTIEIAAREDGLKVDWIEFFK